MTGNHCTIFCVVFLYFAPSTSMEPNEVKMERSFLHISVDGCSTSLVDVGLYARIQGKECLPSTVDGKHFFLSCKHLCSYSSHPASSMLSGFHWVRKHFEGCKEITMMEQVTLLIALHVVYHTFSPTLYWKIRWCSCFFFPVLEYQYVTFSIM